MKYMTGDDYRDMFCAACCDAIDRAHELITTAEVDGEYTDAVEGPNMYAYDQEWFCGGFSGCSSGSMSWEYRKAFSDSFHRPVTEDEALWMIAIWKNSIVRDELFPIAMSTELWPVHGGAFDAVAEQLGWTRVVPYPQMTIGGYYLPSKSPSPAVALVCLNVVRGEARFLSDLRNPSSIIPVAIELGDFDPADWGLA